MEAEPSTAPKELIDQFVSITNSDAGRAAFYLDMFQNDMDNAVSEFFQSAPAASQSVASRGTQDDGSDDGAGNEFYVGGAGRQGGSGQNVVTPGKGKRKSDSKNPDFVKDVFKAAKDSGAAEQESSRSTGQAAGAGMAKYFTGASSNLHGESSGGAPKAKEEELIVLKMWKDGFSLGDGPLRRFDDEENRQFIEDIKRGEIPAELKSAAAGGRVNVDMEDHHDEDYKEPVKPSHVAFSGSGCSMSAPKSTTSSSIADCGDFTLALVPGEPTLRIKIQFLPASNQPTAVQAFHKSHTVATLRKFIASKSGTNSQSFIMKKRTGPTFDILADDLITLEAAKLANQMVIQANS